MKITLFSIIMSIIWGSTLMAIFAFLRNKRQFVDICSVSGIVTLYIFCAFRMVVPLEFPWVIELPERLVLNPFCDILRQTIGKTNISFTELFLLLWMIITIIHLLSILKRYRRCKSKMDLLVSGGIQLNPDRFHINDPAIKIINTPLIKTPVCFGIFQKYILIPNMDLSDNELCLIIRHEYMHLKNHDLLVQMLINILCSIYWWNPFVYLLRNNLGQYFELRCDFSVTKDMSDPEISEYLAVLVKVYKQESLSQNSYALGFLGSQDKKSYNIKERFILLADKNNHPAPVLGKKFALVLSLLLMVASYTFILQPSYDPPQITSPQENIFEVTPENSYIIRNTSGAYIWCMDDGFEKEIDEETANMLIDEGFNFQE